MPGFLFGPPSSPDAAKRNPGLLGALTKAARPASTQGEGECHAIAPRWTNLSRISLGFIRATKLRGRCSPEQRSAMRDYWACSPKPLGQRPRKVYVTPSHHGGQTCPGFRFASSGLLSWVDVVARMQRSAIRDYSARSPKPLGQRPRKVYVTPSHHGGQTCPGFRFASSGLRSCVDVVARMQRSAMRDYSACSPKRFVSVRSSPPPQSPGTIAARIYRCSEENGHSTGDDTNPCLTGLK